MNGNPKANDHQEDKYGMTALHYAALQNDVIKAFSLISQGSNINAKDNLNRTPLHEAAINNYENTHLKISKILLKHGADVNARDNDGRSPLYYLVETGDPKIIKLFVDYKADVNVKDNDKQTLLFPAVLYNENDEVLPMLLDLGLNVNHRNRYARTPLHSAAMRGLLSTAEDLLKSGADVNVRDHEGRVPLWYSILNGDRKMVKLFLRYKANINAVDNEQRNLFFVAVTKNENVKMVQMLIDLGFRVDHRDNNRQTPLHWACGSNGPNLLKYMKVLLKKGGNVNIVDGKGFTPLIEAVKNFSSKMPEDEQVKKSLKFVMGATDFNVAPGNVNVLNFGTSVPDHIWKMIIEHLAKLRVLDVPVHPALLKIVSRQKKYSNYYKQCKEELVKAKSTKLRTLPVTFFNLLVDGKKNLIKHVGNTYFIEDFKKNNGVKGFPIYGDEINENVKKGITRRALFDESTDLLTNDCLPIFKSVEDDIQYYFIVRDVIHCFVSKKDLSKFCE